MKKILSLILILIFIILSIGCSEKLEDKKDNHIEEVEENPEQDSLEPDSLEPEEIPEVIDPIISIIDKMTLEEKIGQLFIVGLEGITMDESTQELIEKYKPSGFILFKRNIGRQEEVKKLIDDLKTSNEKNNIPLFISIDEEGGNISRLRDIYGKSITAAQIGKNNDPQESFKHGQEIGRRLFELGFNLNFAPVLDINTNPENPVIGDRAFGTSSDSVIKHGIAFMKGIEDSGIISCVKHFPGHGDTYIDSHIGLPRVDKTWEELKELELLPFKKAIEENVEMIMLAHILFPNIDENHPASMSKTIITNLLRGDLNYTGVIISDDLTMGGISENYRIEDAALEFFKAGGDIALIAHNEDNYIKSMEVLRRAIEGDEIKIDEIDRKIYRILKLKNIFHE